MRTTAAFLVLGAAALLVCGCPREDFPAAAPVTLEEIDPIRNDPGLTVQEKRARLEELGLAPLTINALLRGERLGNQFGGDLRTAYAKVTAPDFQALTPDEIQIYGDAASQLDSADDLNVTLTDDQAQKIVEFFFRQDISSAEQLEAYLDAGGSVPAAIPAGVLEDLFVAFDPARLLPELP